MLSLAVWFLVAPPPAATPQTPLNPAAVPPALADWTPRPATGPALPWEKATDKDWVDARFRRTDTGPFLDASFRLPAARAKLVVKGTAIRVGDGGVLVDRNTLRTVAGWVGGYLTISDQRFGLLNTPTPAGTSRFAVPTGAGWADAAGRFDTRGAGITNPLPRDWVRYRGLSLHGNEVVLHSTVHGVGVRDHYRHEGGQLIRTIAVDPTNKKLTLGVGNRTATITAGVSAFSLPDLTPAKPYDFAALSQPGPHRWGQAIVTPLVKGHESGPFAVDTLTLPYQNRFGALWFCTGLDFLPDGRLAVCTAHGDVWLATVNEAKSSVSWQRFATGLYQPMGLKVVDGKPVVLERGQLTRLHDQNADGEADFYECLCGDWHGAGGEHSYDTCLETDPAGNFWFFKTGDTDTPHGGCLLRVSKDGSKVEVMATGFRHPIGLGMSATGVVTGADQEGNYMPATRIDQYIPGGFYGDLRAHHRATSPTNYDGPLCWIPREVDNSAGGQVWVPTGTFGPLAGLPLHLSYGRCKAFVLLRDEFPGGVQGGAWDLKLSFLSGVKSGRFHQDGALYVCGLNGWQTAAQADGCVQRVRYTGKPIGSPIALKVTANGVSLTFSEPLDRADAENPAHYRAARWNYRWSKEYGSPRLRPSDGQVGQDDCAVTAARLSADGKTVNLSLAGMTPVMQLQVGMNVKTVTGTSVVGSVYLTPRRVPKAGAAGTPVR